MVTHRARLFRSVFRGEPHRLIYKEVDERYDLGAEEEVWRDVIVVCNQFIHTDFTSAFHNERRSWIGSYVGSDVRKRKETFEDPVSDLMQVCESAVDDRPGYISLR